MLLINIAACLAKLSFESSSGGVGVEREKERERSASRRGGLNTPTYRPKTVSFIKNVKIHTHN